MRRMETPKQPFLSKGGQKRGTKFNEFSLSDTNLAWRLNMERKKSLKRAAAYWKDLKLLALLGNRGSATTCKLDLPATFPLLIFFTGYMDGMQWEPGWIDARRQRGDLHPFPTENRNELKRVQSKKWLHRQQSGEMEKSGVHTSSRMGAHTHHSLLHRGTNQRDTTRGKNKLFANRDAIPPLFHLSLSPWHNRENGYRGGAGDAITINIFLNVLAQKRVACQHVWAEKTDASERALHLDKQKTVPFQGWLMIMGYEILCTLKSQ
jgi:hypothetical protein